MQKLEIKIGGRYLRCDGKEITITGFTWRGGGFVADNGALYKESGRFCSHFDTSDHHPLDIESEVVAVDTISMDKKYARRADPYTEVRVLCTDLMQVSKRVVYAQRLDNVDIHRAVRSTGRFNAHLESENDLVPLRYKPKEIWVGICGFSGATLTSKGAVSGYVHYREVVE